MINKVTFTGRETMLTKGIEKGVSKAHEYVSAGKIYPKAVVESAEREAASIRTVANTADNFLSPFALSAEPASNNKFQAIADNYSYAVAHGKPAQIAEEASMHIDFFG